MLLGSNSCKQNENILIRSGDMKSYIEVTWDSADGLGGAAPPAPRGVHESVSISSFTRNGLINMCAKIDICFLKCTNRGIICTKPLDY